MIMMHFIKTLSDGMAQVEKFDFIPLLALRLYLAPVFWVAGMNKLSDIDSVAAWFGNSEWGLGLPFPELLAWLATLTEVGAAILLVVGLAVRWISIPLIVTMLVAIFAVHWPNGWQAVADPSSPFASADIEEVMRRLGFAREILQEHGNYDWLTERGSIVVSNNGIEWATTYLLMCFVLLFKGAGRYASADYYIKNWLTRQ
jgi:uncharacterized membrane protein YphA (DoxX/SURF4 family)